MKNNTSFIGAFNLLLLITVLLSAGCNKKRPGLPEILVFTKTEGFVHKSISDGVAAIKKLGLENDFNVEQTKKSKSFTKENLDKYAAVIFLNTTGDVLNFNQQVAFERYIQAGGGYAGIHSAADTEYGWDWYGKLVGAYFKSHPKIQEAKFNITDSEFTATDFFTEETWIRTDELYNYMNINPDINVVLTVDESSYEGGENANYHPMAWYHDFDGGRAFYTSLGHTSESYEEELFLQHILGGIQYAIGDNNHLGYEKSRTLLPPDTDRFSKNVLSSGKFFEPTEMTILPNHDILISQRRGELLLYKNETKEINQAGFLDVYHQSGVEGVNAEEGFMGLQKDPNFIENNWLYAFYSPKGDEWVNRLSRFKFIDDSLHMDTEQIILDVGSQREICCHTGGSIAFGPGNLLYVSTGDNSTPFNDPKAKFVNDGFAPLNDLPGKQQYDARRSSGNTNDLRGKIIRIKVNENGTYDIPDGNLFPVGTEKTRPEIYTMGHRNPYRISVDPKTGDLYWGDVGPDSRENKWDTRGPMGYDEMNRAAKPGNFGWPLFVADNKPYREFDYATGESGELFDSENPINNSIYNTGLTELPPAQPAYLFYNYDGSEIHTQVESGGRNAMAGPVFYSDLYGGEGNIPGYYNGKVIIYDWMRGWMKAATFSKEGKLIGLEPFAPNIEVNNLIDLEMGPDGKLYLLEYGSGWFSANDDSGLSFISYNEGNQPPKIASFTADVNSGNAPLTISLTADASDLEEGQLNYNWNFGDGNVEETTVSSIEYTYSEAGLYEAFVEVRDDKNMKAKSNIISIVSGNTRPEVNIKIDGGNSSFFMPGNPVNYEVVVSDADETTIDPSKILVTAEYMDGYDEVELSMGHQEFSTIALGEALSKSLICKTCHKEVEASIGPTYSDIGKKYAEKEDAVAYLQGKMISGGSGIWGEVVMPSNPDLNKEDANKLARYILSLGGFGDTANNLAPKGEISPDEKQQDKTLVLTASYTDVGAEGAVPLTGVKRLIMKSNRISLKEAKDVVEFNPVSFGEMDLLIVPRNGGSFALADIDLSGVNKIDISAGWQSSPNKGIELEVRLNTPDGKLLGKGKMPPPSKNSENGTVSISLSEKINEKVEKLFFIYDPDEKDKLGRLSFIALVDAKFSG